MKTEFAGWNEVARHLIEMADETPLTGASLNKGQRASLKALASRIITNGVVIADEVGMGKTRIAAFVAKAVSLSGGRCAVVIPPGLGFQWQDEFKTCGAPVKPVIRSLWGYFEPWDGPEGVTPWFRQPIVMISHRFSNWRLGETTQTWRWCLLPEIFAAARQLIDGRLPRGYHEYAGEYAGNVWVQRVATAARSIVQSVPAKSSNPARRLVSDLLSKVRWPEPLYPQNYGRQESLRDHLEAVVGLGLGVFDLVIIDEAHKSRGDDSGLSRVLEKVVLEAIDSRRIALTATPIELDDRQWSMTFKRIAIRSEEVDKINIATTQYGESIRRLRLGWRASEALRADYHKAALQFKDTLSPYLLRRDKREDEDVLEFEKYSGLPIHDYRRQEEISVDLNDLSPAWRQAVCAAEALSVIRAPAADPKTKRLRLTIGNGHGIASVIDEALRDEAEDRKQDQFETSQVEIERIVSSIAKTGTSASDRLRWWEDKLRRSLTSSQDILFDHPAILAAVENIEHETEQGEKVLVFGRFTRPLRTLVSLLNARQMLLQIANGGTWPQRKVFGDRIANYGESEWPAVVAAHRQLASSIDLDTLDDVLSERYRKDTELRIKQRDALVQRIRAGLETVADNGKYSALLKIIEQHSSSTTDESEDDDRHLTLLLRAITANLDNSEPSDADIASAFITLVNAASDRDTTEEEEFDDEKALFAWKNLEEYLAEGYTNRQGGFARLMYGETKPQTRRMIQLAFNRPNSFPRVLVAQSLVGREGLNLHESCRIVILLHPEWNPGVVEQQIGRVDRVNCRWAKELNTALLEGKGGQDLPRIVIRPVIFKGTYDEHNWKVLQDRWDDLRAQLHGEAIPARLRVIEDDEGRKIFDEIAQSRPDFSPTDEKMS